MALEISGADEGMLPAVSTLFREYAASLDFDLTFQGFEEELAGLPGAYAPPRGCILVARQDSKIAGCVALRPLEGGICELKRLYVRPGFQGQGIGRALTEALLVRAEEYGYEKVRLDTISSMEAAMHLYRSTGFYPIDPYRENPIPGAQFFEKRLGT